MSSSTSNQDEWELKTPKATVELTKNHISTDSVMKKICQPSSGAIVIFAGVTRDNFNGKAVKSLEYSAYNKMALKSMMKIAQEMVTKHSLDGIYIVHRLGLCPVGETSIVIAVSTPHRKAAWEAGEQTLELCKENIEVWKKEEFETGEQVWKANKEDDTNRKGSENSTSVPSENKKNLELELDLSNVARPVSYGTSGQVIRPRRLGEGGRGAVVNRPTPANIK